MDSLKTVLGLGIARFWNQLAFTNGDNGTTTEYT